MSSRQLLVIRHAIAEDRERFARTGEDDARRPLTADGRKRMRKGAAGLRAIVPEIALLATSPFTRAAETAVILVDAYEGLDAIELDELTPEASPTRFLAWFTSLKPLGDGTAPVAIVGHEPHLSSLVTWLVSGKTRPVLALRKGGACLIEFDGAIERGGGQIIWVLTPAQLRKLGRR